VGAGDSFGQATAHGVASGMGGIRTAGDLVARMQFTRGMRLIEAKQFVADKLGCSTIDLSDPVAMLDIRKEKGLGSLYESEITNVDEPIAIEAKFNISALLGIPINSVELFKQKINRFGAKL
jgi:dimethylamine---corrinoid protein Co-methyltransferase